MLTRFIQRPILSIVLSLLLVFVGVLALLRLPVTQFPTISPPKVTIIADYPGANNELLVKAVVIPLERAINGAPGLKYIASDAGNDGEANIQAVFNLGTDPNQATLAVQNRVASVVNKLPPLVVREGVKITREEPNMLLYINVSSDDPKADQKFLYNFADINLLSELKRVDGVGSADILGNREYAMRIWLKPDRMRDRLDRAAAGRWRPSPRCGYGARHSVVLPPPDLRAVLPRAAHHGTQRPG